VKKIYLFDWGDTLMLDFPGIPGKMRDWDHVEVVEGAFEVLDHLSQTALIYIATGAAESSESDIREAFVRVSLNQFITGYFCKANIGISKGEAAFIPTILSKLDVDKSHVYMIGDSLDKDIIPATAAGIQPIWLTRNVDGSMPSITKVIRHLSELCV
jgi:putative hydrolase of the HAD superfamily